MNFKLEIIGFNIESCRLAQEAGANRIELCDNPADGGTTPSKGFIQSARNHLQIELYPIIRPRGGDFLYSEDEYEIMIKDIAVCKELQCDGVVVGMLHADGRVDKERCSRLVEQAYPLGVTFHRAFDRTNDPFAALEDIIDSGFERILTSGLKPTAPEGAETLATLVKQADGRIIIMPGSGVRSDNVGSLATITGAEEFHSSARMNLDSKMNYLNIAMKENLHSVIADAEEIKKIIASLTRL
ncbi:MAG: copper homeostasis protein CutC [Chitinophagaceae bacterium]|nr:copper homeostasis protein CutC [Chitinophagaceae bacterium]MBL0057041.1 copper homeostasis protein CutC [Chitinophagaceae bacterium]